MSESDTDLTGCIGCIGVLTLLFIAGATLNLLGWTPDGGEPHGEETSCDPAEQDYLEFSATHTDQYQRMTDHTLYWLDQWLNGEASDGEFKIILDGVAEDADSIERDYKERNPYPGYEEIHNHIQKSAAWYESGALYLMDYVDSRNQDDWDTANEHFDTSADHMEAAASRSTREPSSC